MSHSQKKEHHKTPPQPRYDLRPGDTAIASTEDTVVDKAVEPVPSSPYFEQCTGKIVGVSFSPASPEIHLQQGSATVTASCTAQHVEEALALRDQEVEAMLLMSQTPKTCRLLWLRDAVSPFTPPTHEETVDYLSLIHI